MDAQTDGVTVKGRGTTPPYIPFRTFKTFLQDLEEHGVPGRVDSTALKRFAGGVARQLKTALRFLNLVDADDHPTDDLKALSGAFGREGWPAALSGLLRAHYSPVLSRIDLSSATPGQLRDAFKDGFGGNANEGVLRKSELFFLQAAQEAGIPISKRIPIITRQRSAGSSGRRRSKNGFDATSTDRSASNTSGRTPPPNPDSSGRQDPPKPQEASLQSQLLNKFPEFDPTWPDEIKAQWFQGFQKLMGMVSDQPQKNDGEPQ